MTSWCSAAASSPTPTSQSSPRWASRRSLLLALRRPTSSPGSTRPWAHAAPRYRAALPRRAPHDIAHQGRRLARHLADADARLLQGLLLRLGGARRAGDDRAGVTHRLAFRRGEPGHVADDRLAHVLLDERRGPFLGVAADLADHHDRRRLRVVLERPEAVDMRGADHRVTADADGG